MHRTNLRKVGGSVMLAVPRPVLEVLHLGPGASVDIRVERDRLVVEPHARPRYALEELLAQCNPKARRSKEEREWLSNKPVGGELI
ncbi:MAG: antitoxin [Terriglobia bacterium]|jgi:antitoxin ChpS